MDEATLVANLYGEHEYSKETFDSSKTVEELKNLSITEDLTTNAYVITGKVKLILGTYSNQIKITNAAGDVELNLYCSDATKQYEFLTPYDGQEISIDIIPCNWNEKTYYAFCVLSITVDGQTIVNNCNFK